MRRNLLLSLIICIPFLVFAQSKNKKANQETDRWRYEIESVSVGTQGNCVIKVWSYAADPKVATEQAKKNAIHGVVFKGIPTKDRIPGKKPLIEDTAKESEHADFLKSFFADGGDYMRYVTLTNSGAVAAGDIMKVAKKEYKVGLVVNVNYSDLRSYLESKGVVKKLSSGF